ncbi:MAG TPA: hypothetical protein VGJ84_22595, partial [Polyangiaceae bacterium]
MSLRIQCVGAEPHRVIRYAAEELERYLSRMGAAGSGEIQIGLASHFEMIQPFPVADAALDDAIEVDVRGGQGHIAGGNPRSVLLAVYRYLTELGCRWVRPGAEGELIPALESLPDVRLRETPSYRHRGVCIEGSLSVDHARDIIDWMPKLGLNAYFIQFREAHTFFDRWYAKHDQPSSKAPSISLEQARGHTRRVVEEIEKRGLVYHAVGHGWTCEPFGISGTGWEKEASEPPENIRQYLAEVKGERRLWHGIALNTNLCYGNPEVRRTVIQEIAGYADQHREIDVLHFWLADGSNNHCECSLCRDTSPADFYVQMLNQLDVLLGASGLSTKIVFLIYVDLLWPPMQDRLKNPDRFILMFAPITRTYASSFALRGELPPLPPFQRNQLEFPKSVESNLAFLAAWQTQFSGDSFDFDYHLMWDYLLDPGQTRISRILFEDVKNLAGIRLNGLVSCQSQRVFFPNSLAMTAMGAALWNSGADYQKLAFEYHTAAYGPDGSLVLEYLHRLTELF